MARRTVLRARGAPDSMKILFSVFDVSGVQLIDPALLPTTTANFDLWGVAEKEERKRKKRRKKEEKKRKKGDFPIGLVIQRYSSLSVFWVRPGQFSRPFIVSFMRMSHPSRKKQVQNCTEWTISPHYVVDSGEHIGPEITKVLIKI